MYEYCIFLACYVYYYFRVLQDSTHCSHYTIFFFSPLKRFFLSVFIYFNPLTDFLPNCTVFLFFDHYLFECLSEKSIIYGITYNKYSKRIRSPTTSINMIFRKKKKKSYFFYIFFFLLFFILF